MYYEFKVGDNTYKLRLSTKQIIELEKELGHSAILIFGTGESDIKLPSVENMVNVLYRSLQQLNHGISREDAFDIFDKWLEAGNTIEDFVYVIVEVYKVSGLFRTEDKIEKN